MKHLNNVNVKLQNVNDANILISEGMAKINSAERLGYKTTIQERKQVLTEFLDMISDAYALLCGYQCSLSIKILVKSQSTESFYLETICRDSRATKERVFSRNERTRQYIVKNTSFSYLFKRLYRPDGRYFIENNLPLRKGYMNPSFELYTPFKFEGLPNDLTDEERLKFWKLPFKSTIVVPILPRPDSREGELDCKGVLTVDCDETDVFDEKYHVETLISMADHIYNYMSQFTDILIEEFIKVSNDNTKKSSKNNNKLA